MFPGSARWLRPRSPVVLLVLGTALLGSASAAHAASTDRTISYSSPVQPDQDFTITVGVQDIDGTGSDPDGQITVDAYGPDDVECAFGSSAEFTGPLVENGDGTST